MICWHSYIHSESQGDTDIQAPEVLLKIVDLKVISVLPKAYSLRLGNVTVEALADSLVNFIIFFSSCVLVQ